MSNNKSAPECVTKWGNQLQMLFNFYKCKVLHVRKSNIKHQYSMGVIPLDNVSEGKDLGIAVTESFNQLKRVTLLLQKWTEFLGLLKKNILISGQCYVNSAA